MFLKYLIGPLLLASSLPAGEEGGWFPVEKREKSQVASEVEDASLWVLFLKDLRLEKFFVKFPAEPTYQYTALGDFRVSVVKDDVLYQLTVEPTSGGGGAIEDLLYLDEGKWVREHFVQSEHHFYRFKVVSSEPEKDFHRDFFSSFSIEKNRDFF
jgi:hypothetical protein